MAGLIYLLTNPAPPIGLADHQGFGFDGTYFYSVDLAGSVTTYLSSAQTQTLIDGQCVKLTGDQSITGVKTFTTAKRLVTTVAGLPSAATVGAGALAYVSDANTTLTLGIGTVVVGGGANNVPVGSDGTNWIIGG